MTDRAPLLAALGFGATALMLLATGAGDAVRAQALANHDSNAPVSFAADRIELQDRQDRVVVSGAVRVEQAGLVLTAQRMTIAYTRAGGTDVNRIDATGGVTVRKGTETARGAVAIYDLDRRIITLIGGVELTQGANRLSGARLLIDLTTGRASVDGRGDTPSAPGVADTPIAAQPSGRVTGTFTVPRRD